MNIFKRIFYSENKDYRDDVIADLRRANEILKFENAALLKSQRKPLKVIDPAAADPVPTDINARKDYVEKFCNLYKDFLEGKLIHLIAQVREDLDWNGWNDYAHPEGLPNGMTRSEYDAYLRGTSNSLKLLIEYGNQLESENLANKEK